MNGEPSGSSGPPEDKLRPHLAELVREGVIRSPTATFRTRGGCMRPLLLHGSTVYVEGVDPQDIRRGDLVIVVSEGRLMAHRVVRFRHREGRRLFLTKGDITDRADDPMGETQVLGRVVAIQRGTRLRRLDTPGWQLAGAVIAFLSPWSRWFVGPLRFLRRRLSRRPGP